jgi:hypothetical protein
MRKRMHVKIQDSIDTDEHPRRDYEMNKNYSEQDERDLPVFFVNKN